MCEFKCVWVFLHSVNVNPAIKQGLIQGVRHVSPNVSLDRLHDVLFIWYLVIHHYALVIGALGRDRETREHPLGQKD